MPDLYQVPRREMEIYKYDKLFLLSKHTDVKWNDNFYSFSLTFRILSILLGGGGGACDGIVG
jgi:hypothetical protein